MIETNDLLGVEKHLDESDKILTDSNNRYHYAHNLQARAFLELKRNNIAKAVELFKRSALISQQEGDSTNYHNCLTILGLLKT